MNQAVTQAHLAGAVKEIIAHFNESQGEQNKGFDRIDTRLDRIDTRLNTIEGDLKQVKTVVLDLMPLLQRFNKLEQRHEQLVHVLVEKHIIAEKEVAQ